MLATNYCYRYKSDYSVVLFLHLLSLEDLHYSLALITRHNESELPFDEQIATKANVQSILVLLQNLRYLLKRAPSWLIHVDDFRSLFDPLKTFFPLPGSTDWGNGSLLITRKEKYVGVYNVYRKTVDLDTGLSPAEAKQLVANISKDDDNKRIARVVKELDYLPLGLVNIAVYHGSRKQLNPSWTWSDSLSRYNKSKSSFRLPAEVNLYNKSLVQAVDIAAREAISSYTSNCGITLVLFGMLKATRLPVLFVEKYWEALDIDTTALYNDKLLLIAIDKSSVLPITFFTVHQVTQYVLTGIVNETVRGTAYRRNVEAITDALIGIHEEYLKRLPNNSILLRSVRPYFKMSCGHELVSVDKRILLYCALGVASVLTVDGEQARLKYTSWGSRNYGERRESTFSLPESENLPAGSYVRSKLGKRYCCLEVLQHW